VFANVRSSRGTPVAAQRSFFMLRSEDLAERAGKFDELADRVIDPQVASSMRQRAREWRALAAEVRVLQCDPMYRLIHDRQESGTRPA